MIHSVLSAIRDDLNAFLMSRLDPQREVVVLSELMNLDGSVAATSENIVICTLLNIEQERMSLNVPQGFQNIRNNPPLCFNLYVLFSAFYKAGSYKDALLAISLTIKFFQGKQVFTPANTPGLELDIVKLTIEIVNTEMKDLSNFWTALGAKHLPSILYRIRMVQISADNILEEVSDIRILDIPTEKM